MDVSRHFYHAELYCIDLAQIYAICFDSFKTSLIIYANLVEKALLHWVHLRPPQRKYVLLRKVVSLSLHKFVCIIRAE